MMLIGVSCSTEQRHPKGFPQLLPPSPIMPGITVNQGKCVYAAENGGLMFSFNKHLLYKSAQCPCLLSLSIYQYNRVATLLRKRVSRSSFCTVPAPLQPGGRFPFVFQAE